MLRALATGRSQVRRSGRVRQGVLAAILLLLVVAAAGSAQVDTEQPSDAVVAVAGAIQPGDLIRVKVWREPDLSDSTRVDEHGNVTLPRLGQVPVAGISADSVRSLIVTTYARFLRDPAVEVTVLPRVTILGAVRTPGVRNLDPTMTIADALAVAGGAAPDGKTDRVEVRRRGERLPVKLSLDARLAETPIQSGDQLFVPQRSWLSRNAGIVIGAVSLVISLTYLVRRI
jgi:protein involved in polysaccharide export with SLBB domain